MHNLSAADMVMTLPLFLLFHTEETQELHYFHCARLLILLDLSTVRTVIINHLSIV